jgi:hypothetical protein
MESTSWNADHLVIPSHFWNSEVSLDGEVKSALLIRLSCPFGGALRNVINAGRDAVDVAAAQDGRGKSRTAKSCGPDPPTLGSSLR